MLVSVFLVLLGVTPAIAAQPGVGAKAPDFALKSLEGKTVRLSALTAKGPVVLVALRGFPGYQCPICNRQGNEFIRSAQGFADLGVQVVMVYPGPPQNLDERAREFTADKTLPPHFQLLLDPGYEFTNLYGLRWDAPNETAYPSTFLIDQRGTIFFAKVSNSHGGRTNPAELIEILSKKKAAQ